MRRFGAGIAALLVAATAAAAPARAADMPVTPGYYPPVFPPAAIYHWTGFYIGGNLGADVLSDHITQAAAGTTALTGPANNSPVGFIGGGQFGFNYQVSALVLGVEATISATNTSGTAHILNSTPSTDNFTSAPRWLATATGRVGFAANDLLFYGRGGAAVMHTDYTESVSIGRVTSISTALNDNRTGFVAGVGLEYGLTENWSARAEYDFLGFGTKTYNFPAPPVAIKSDLSMVTVGVNYRFTFGGGAPLGARY